MTAFKPSFPYSTVLIVLKPTFEKVAGVRTKVLPDLDKGFKIHCSFRSFGGTETTVDNVYSIVDTVDVETWFRPDITSECVVVVPETGAKYQIINQPENINNRNQFLKFKLERIKGGV